MRKITLNDIVAEPKPPEIQNYIVVLNDRSGSMVLLQDTVTKETTKKIEEIFDKAEESGIKTFVKVIDFSFKRSPTAWFDRKFTLTPVIENQGTNLNWALHETLGELQKTPIPKNVDGAFLVLVMTDGQDWPDEAGRNYGSKLACKLAEIPANFTVAIMGPGTIREWANSVGIPEGNVIVWDGKTETSYQQTMSAQSVGLSNYYQTRSTGGSSTQSFYEVQPDKILDSELTKLKKLGSKEYAIISSAEPKIELRTLFTKSGFSFKTGVGYYELLKPEKIQENKDILVMDEKGNVYGNGANGADVRRFLGLPSTGTILVHPKKGKYTIFVQSNSNNRKIISWVDKETKIRRCQKVLVLL